MKRLAVVLAVLGLAAAAVTVISAEVTSVNAVGFNKIQIPEDKLVLVCNPFLAMDGSTLDDIIGDQLPLGSAAHVWDRENNNYTTVIRSSRGGWGGVTLNRGDSLWLEVPDSVVTNEVNFMGEVPDTLNLAGTTTVTIVGIDAVGYSYPVERAWTNTTLALNSALGDALHVWDVDSQGYSTYIKSSRGGWGAAENLVLQIGQSFWYEPVSGSNDWTEIVPYDLRAE